MRSVLCTLLLGAVIASSQAIPDLTSADIDQVSARIVSVVQGGRWKRQNTHGFVRMIVTVKDTAEYETNEYFLQWLKTDWNHSYGILEHTTAISEICNYNLVQRPLLQEGLCRDGQSFKLTAATLGTDDDKIFTITPRADHTYSLTVHSVTRNIVNTAVGLTFLSGAVFAFLTYLYAKRHRRLSAFNLREP